MALDPAQQVSFDKALVFVLREEGGYSNDPADHGGPTNLGVVQREYDHWRDAHNHPRQSVAAISHAEASEIYIEKYWLPAHCGLLGWPASLALFDSVVNCGLSQGIKFLQRALHVRDDGVCGPATQSAMAARPDAKALRDSICDQRAGFYRQIAEHRGQSVFLRGWLNRVGDLRVVR